MAKRGKEKVHVVMSEFKKGTLHSGSGQKVTSRKQAVAIALSEAGLSRKKKKKSKHNPSGVLLVEGGHVGAEIGTFIDDVKPL